MKKLVSLLLALALAATLCVGALAEAIDYTGLWTLTTIRSGEITFPSSDLGVYVIIALNADGSCAMSTQSANEAVVTETGTWAVTETGVSMTDEAGDTIQLVYAEGTLALTEEGTDMIFVPFVQTQPLAGLTVSDFNGMWELQRVETTTGTYSAADRGVAMAVILEDGLAAISMGTADTEPVTYTAQCQTYESEIGTVLQALLMDPETGEMDGSGMLFLLYDDGALVWYEYDATNEIEYYYCFTAVAE